MTLLITMAGPAAAEQPPCPAPPCAAPAASDPAAAGPPAAPAAALLPADAPGPATTPAPAPRRPVDPVRRRCKIAGVVMLSLAGVTLLGFFGSLIYNAAVNPNDLTLAAEPRLVFAVSALTFGVAGGLLLGYGLSTPPSVPLTPTSKPSRSPAPSLLPPGSPTTPEAPTGGAPAATLELRF